jgi:hypothetical protein
MGGPQSRSGRRGEAKILDSTETRTPTPLSYSPKPVAVPTALFQLLTAYKGVPAEILSMHTMNVIGRYRPRFYT